MSPKEREKQNSPLPIGRNLPDSSEAEDVVLIRNKSIPKVIFHQVTIGVIFIALFPLGLHPFLAAFIGTGLMIYFVIYSFNLHYSKLLFQEDKIVFINYMLVSKYRTEISRDKILEVFIEEDNGVKKAYLKYLEDGQERTHMLNPWTKMEDENLDWLVGYIQEYLA